MVAVVPLVVAVVATVAEGGTVVLDCGPGVVLGAGADVDTDVDVDVESSPREIDALSSPPQPTSATLPNAAAKLRTTLRFAVKANPGGTSTTPSAPLRGPARSGRSLAGGQ